MLLSCLCRAGVGKPKGSGSASELAAAGRKEAGEAKALPKALSDEKNGKRREVEQSSVSRKGLTNGPALSGILLYS